MVTRDKKVDHYQLFFGQEKIKRILQDIRYNLDDLDSRMTWVERYVASDIESRFGSQPSSPTVITTPT